MSSIEGKHYSLNNPYLTQDEKVSVESWFQLPGNVMEYTFLLMAVLSISYPISISYIIGIPLVANIVAGVINWYLYNTNLTRMLGLSVFHPYVTGLVGLGVAGYLFMNDAWLLAIVAAATAIFGFFFLELHILLYSILAQKYRMHPKYVFAKKKFGHTFPFENSPE